MRAGRALLLRLLAAGFLAPALVACQADDPRVEAAEECPPYPIWNRAVLPPGPDEVVLNPEPPDVSVGSGSDTAAALRSLSANIDIGFTVKEERPARPDAAPGDVSEVDVTDDRGREGTYPLAMVGDIRVVSGGRGCGAPPPTGLDVPCPNPPIPPEAEPGDTISVLCVLGDPEPLEVRLSQGPRP